MIKIPFSPPDISEKEIQAVSEVLRSGWITTGPKTKEFEEKIAAYCGTKKAFCMNSATAALEGVLRLYGVGIGDEIITSAYTYTATASVIVHLGATPVLIDTQKESYEMDYDQLEKAITSKTKAIIAVDIGGVICDYETIYQIAAKKSKLFCANSSLQEVFRRPLIIADAAHSFGAIQKGVHSGNIADFSCFSFHAVKNLTTGEGGAVTWKTKSGMDDAMIYREFMLYALHGQTKDALEKTKVGAWEYDIVMTGYKCNMTDISAAIGIAQLENYKHKLAVRKQLSECYDDALKDMNVTSWRHFTQDFSSSCHLYMLQLQEVTLHERNAVIETLARREIAANVHYKPLPMLTAYKNLGFNILYYKNAYALYEKELTLPLYSTLTVDNARYVAENLKDVLKGL